MPLYIRDPAVDSLLDQYLAATGQTNKTEAVRRALADQLKALAAKGSLAERVAKVQRQAAEAGFLHSGGSDPAADKKFMDDMWGEG
ncbi:type II toxin-antitoxin system VapB family antitoxin [Rhodobacter sp. SGA-6-6]|uniref:type II toxin-antitoxin system VapB family antitoxin n=1 Tax=Rhodobacter sp. SGA-6-6 TaxID=2710882 RepID=UPI0013EE3159|nr:type II toxin-antitoxin system VapB family antitoxin [Rhodobacter sp. SGA-6-6]NGM47838.1 type II toxin-antitoxin system VapB family antitoxin [Rhodobacter sp. SGA-6-6]